MAASAKQAEEERQKNRSMLLKLCSHYFLAKNRIPHTTTFEGQVKLQVANGDEILRHHVEQGPSNAQYTLNFSSQSLLIAIDSWIDSNLIANLQVSQFFPLWLMNVTISALRRSSQCIAGGY